MRSIIIFLLSSAGTILLGFLPDANTATNLFKLWGYWIILAGFALFVTSTIPTNRRLFKWLRSRETLTTIAICVVVATFLYSRESPQYKIVQDEPNLASTALSLHENREPTISEPSFGSHGAISTIDKRPLFYPFLVASIHDLLGFNPNHPFYLNLGLTGILLLLTHTVVYSLSKSSKAAWLSVCLLSSHPLISQNSSGAGFEILNCVMILSVFIATNLYLRNTSKESLSLLLSLSVLLAQTRYESALYVPAVAGVVILGYIKSKQILISKIMIAIPWLCILIPWQNTYVRSEPKFWQLPADADSAFGIEYLKANLQSAYTFFINPPPYVAGSPALFAIGILSLFGAIAFQLSKAKHKLHFHSIFLSIATAILATTLLVSFAILMTYHWGTLSDPPASRLALPIILLLSVSFGLASKLLIANMPSIKWLPTAIAIACWSISLPIINKSEYSKYNPYINRFEWVLDKTRSSINENHLIISSEVRQYSSYNINSISVKRAMLASKHLKLHMELQTYDNIYIVQSGSYKQIEGKLQLSIHPGNEVGPAFELETVATTSFHPYNFTRLSKVTQIDINTVESFGGPGAYQSKFLSNDFPVVITLNNDELQAWRNSLP